MSPVNVHTTEKAGITQCYQGDGHSGQPARLAVIGLVMSWMVVSIGVVLLVRRRNIKI